MKFNEQIIRDVYEGQVAMLTGGGKSDGDGGAGDGAGDDDSETIIGIENKLKLIQKNQKKLKERIENVSKKLIQQKNLSASALSATQSSRHHPQVAISYAERCYYLQLKSWDEILQKYEKLIKNITISKEYLSQSHGPSAPSSSLMSGVGGNLMDLIQLSEDEERICEKLLGSQVCYLIYS